MTDLTSVRRLPPSLVLLALASGCVPEFGVDLSAIRAPKLIAIAASPAEPKAGEKTTLSALVAAPPGTSAPAVAWSLCLERKSLTELGAVNPACLDLKSDAERVELGRGDSALATIDQDVCRLFGPLRPTLTADEPAGRPVDPDVSGGFYQPVVAGLDGVASLGAIRIDCDPANLNRDDALRFRQLYRPNENPRVSALSFGVGDGPPEREPPSDGTGIEIEAGSTVTLRAAWDDCPTESSCGGAEAYVWYNRETQRIEPRREAISVAWFTSSGGFENEQTGLAEGEAANQHHTENRWHAGEEPGQATVWVVMRDSRAGQSWRQLPFVITP